MGNFNPYPTVCNVCGGKVIYGKMEEFGIKPFQSGKCYVCTECGAYVGTHKNTPEEALGTLAHKRVRGMRAACHEELERHCGSLDGRNLFYLRLGEEMGYKDPKTECHFGHMDESELQKALEIMTTKLKDVVYK